MELYVSVAGRSVMACPYPRNITFPALKIHLAAALWRLKTRQILVLKALLTAHTAIVRRRDLFAAKRSQ